MRKKLIVSLSMLMMFFLVGCGILGQVEQPVANHAPTAKFTFTPATPKMNEVITFNASSSSDSNDSINQLQARWDFDGDGNWEIDYVNGKRASQEVTYVYSTPGTYKVVLEIKDSGGLKASQEKTITVATILSQSPTASFSFTPAVPKVNETVTFNASTSTDEEDAVSQLKVKWDFNNDGIWDIDYTDGKMAIDVVTYSYRRSDNYTVVLEVKDSSGLISKLRKTLTVSEQSGGNQAPTASFVFSPSTPEVNDLVTFNASASTDKEDSVSQLQARWDFNNDGVWDIDYTNGKKASDTVTFSYNVSGNYTVVLEVKDRNGLTSSQTKDLFIRDVNQSPTASFVFLPTTPEVNELVTFNASASTDEEDSVSQLQARWDFNNDGVWDLDYTNGKKASDAVTHVYNTSGTYQVTLEVKDTGGLVHQQTELITVEEPIPTYVISGYIVESRGGSGIDNAELSLVSNSGKEYYDTTDANGEFSFEVTEFVSHQLSVTKSGYSNSSAQGLLPGQSYSTDLSIPLREEFYSGWGDKWPEISISGLSGSLSGKVIYTIDAMEELTVKLGEVQYGPHGYYEKGTFFGSVPISMEFDTTSMPNGETYIRVSMYDVNENYVELYQNISIANVQWVPLLDPPEIDSLQAVTTGSSLQMLSEESKNSLSTKIGQNLSLDEIQIEAAFPDSTVFTVLKWVNQVEASGYKIYRSTTSANSDYTLVGILNDPYVDPDKDIVTFVDTSSILTPGKKVYYKISSYDYSGESDLSPAVYTIPLEPFRVSLISPDIDEVVRERNPILSWDCNQVVGENRYYKLHVRGVTDSIISWEITKFNTLYAEYDGIPLKSGKEYEWNLVETYAETVYSPTSSAISYSSDDYSAMNGWYRFRTEF